MICLPVLRVPILEELSKAASDGAAGGSAASAVHVDQEAEGESKENPDVVIV